MTDKKFLNRNEKIHYALKTKFKFESGGSMPSKKFWDAYFDFILTSKLSHKFVDRDFKEYVNVHLGYKEEGNLLHGIHQSVTEELTWQRPE